MARKRHNLNQCKIIITGRKVDHAILIADENRNLLAQIRLPESGNTSAKFKEYLADVLRAAALNV